MSWELQGIGASPGRVMGPVRRFRWSVPSVEHRTIAPDEVEEELKRFEEARSWAVGQTRSLMERTRDRLGKVEAKIFEPQILMLEDPDLVDGTLSYIEENYLSAERAFEWRVLELRSQILDSAHVMVKDRLADLRDIRIRVLSRLLEGSEAALRPEEAFGDDPVVLSFDDVTPSFAVDLDPERVLGLLAARGSRASHSAVLARSLGIAAVVGLGDQLYQVDDGTEVIFDGSSGRVVVEPTEEQREAHRRSRQQSTARRERLEELAREPSVSADGISVTLQVSLDQPGELDEATRVRPDGVGLFRSEFLVTGRREIPSEEQQYRAYRRVVEAFPEQAVTLRTFDIGGDKFPMFLEMPSEENPYLGWRAIRICLDRPDLFRNQLRAALRASRHGDVRLLLPFIVSAEELRRTGEILREVHRETGVPDDEVPLGMMVETPAAVETLDLLAPHVDFISVGTNDLTQYTLAVDRGNARLTERFDELHPALFRVYDRIRRTADEHGLAVSVCGSAVFDPAGLAAFLGLGYRTFSLPASRFPEVKEWLRSLEVRELEHICQDLFDCESAGEIRAQLSLYLEATVPPETVPAGRLSKPL